jgi:hypothetical protein
MHLTRPLVLGLALGAAVAFVAALLRPRPSVQPPGVDQPDLIVSDADPTDPSTSHQGISAQ